MSDIKYIKYENQKSNIYLFFNYLILNLTSLFKIAKLLK